MQFSTHLGFVLGVALDWALLFDSVSKLALTPITTGRCLRPCATQLCLQDKALLNSPSEHTMQYMKYNDMAMMMPNA